MPDTYLNVNVPTEHGSVLVQNGENEMEWIESFVLNTPGFEQFAEKVKDKYGIMTERIHSCGEKIERRFNLNLEDENDV